MPTTSPPLSRWTKEAFACFLLNVLANLLGWAFVAEQMGANESSKPIEHVWELVFVPVFLITSPLLPLVGAVCAVVGLREKPGRKGLSITALVLNLLLLVPWLAWLLR